MLRKHRSQLLLLAAILALALGLSAGGVVLAQAQPQLTSYYVTEPLPVADPQAALWDSIDPVEIPLIAQAGVPPALPKLSVQAVRVRTANDGRWIAFLLEWDDATRDGYASRIDQFRDAAAVQLPVDTNTPGVCMGFRGKPVNLWHWKADWQSDIDEGFRDVVDAYPNFWKDYYPFAVGAPPFRAPADFSSADARSYLVGWAAGNPLSDPARGTPVEELAAMGFGTATHRKAQTVLGRGVWSNGTWRVVYARPMASSEAEAVQFQPGGKAFAAFAVWNGSNQEVGARKQVTADVTLNIEAAAGAAAPAAGGLPWWAVLLIGAGAVVIGASGVYGYGRMARRSKAKTP